MDWLSSTSFHTWVILHLIRGPILARPLCNRIQSEAHFLDSVFELASHSGPQREYRTYPLRIEVQMDEDLAMPGPHQVLKSSVVPVPLLVICLLHSSSLMDYNCLPINFRFE